MSDFIPRTGCLLLLAAVSLHAARAGELVADGDFGTLDGWEQLPIPRGFTREIADDNSPFTEVYPDNGMCLLLGDDPESTSAHVRYMQQGVFTSARQVEFSMDFKILEESMASFQIALLSGENTVVSVLTRPNFTLNLFAGNKADERWVLPGKQQIEHSVWYHFRCRIDLDSGTMEGRLVSTTGDTWEFMDHPVPVDPDDPQATIDGILIGAHAGAHNYAPRTLMDNFSLRPLPQGE